MIPKNPEVLNSIRGQLLVAMPQIEDKRFRQSVILMCQFDSETAMEPHHQQAATKIGFRWLMQKAEITSCFFSWGFAYL